MAKRFLAPAAVAVGLLLSGTTGGLAGSAGQSGEASYLNGFHGRWTGSGTISIAAGTTRMPLTCNVSGQAQGERLAIRGRCSGSGFSTNVSATLRYDAQAGTYAGTWSDGATGSAGLSGSRRGKTLNLVVSGSGARRMTLTVQGSHFRLNLKRPEGQPLVNIAFRRT